MVLDKVLITFNIGALDRIGRGACSLGTHCEAAGLRASIESVTAFWTPRKITNNAQCTFSLSTEDTLLSCHCQVVFESQRSSGTSARLHADCRDWAIEAPIITTVSVTGMMTLRRVHVEPNIQLAVI
jgi:hypothetical protein